MITPRNEYNNEYNDANPLEELQHFVVMKKDSPINFRKNSDYIERTETKDVVCCCYDLRGFSTFCVEEPQKAKEIILIVSHEYVELTFDDQCDYYKLLGDGLLIIYNEHVLDDPNAFLKKIELHFKGINNTLKNMEYPKSIAGAISFGSVVEYEIFGGRPNVQYKDYFGYPINAACRLQGLANGYEIILENKFLGELKRRGANEIWIEENHTSVNNEYFKGIKKEEKIIGRIKYI